MNILVVGLGSMGKRRIRLIKGISTAHQIYGVDTNAERCASVRDEFEITTYESIEAAAKAHDFEAGFICTSPLSHNKIVTELLENKINVFTELNLVADGYDHNIALAKEKGLLLFLSSTFLYRDEISKVRSIVDKSTTTLNYNYHVGQYLPDWHPWESYKDFFVGNKRTNGCREIFAIELPWLVKTFGAIQNVTVVKGNISDLDIDYPDNYCVILEHESGTTGTLSVNIVSRVAVRNLEVYGEDTYLSWNGTPTGLFNYNFTETKLENVVLSEPMEQLANYSSFIVENAYTNEIVTFFNALKGEGTVPYGFEDDLQILNLIDTIEGI